MFCRVLTDRAPAVIAPDRKIEICGPLAFSG